MRWDASLTPNFAPDEMACKCGTCGGQEEMTHDFMRRLQRIRDAFGPMTITSGFRCSDHPEERIKKKPGSHAQGRAADIAVSNAQRRYELIRLAFEHGMIGIGIANGFVHLDAGHKYAARPAVWKYS